LASHSNAFGVLTLSQGDARSDTVTGKEVDSWVLGMVSGDGLQLFPAVPVVASDTSHSSKINGIATHWL
jgi:hypothetical protein